MAMEVDRDGQLWGYVGGKYKYLVMGDGST